VFVLDVSWIFEKTTMRGIRNYDIIFYSLNTTISTPRVEVSYTSPLEHASLIVFH